MVSIRQGHRQTWEIIRGDARRWFKMQHEDFRTVCESAGVDAGRVHAFAMTKIREAIAIEHQRTAEFLKGSMPGVVAEIAKELGDRPTPTAQKTENLEFSQNQDLP